MLLQPESVIYNTATEVVEHLRHPGKELDRLWSLLKPGGNLGIWLAAQWDAKLTFADKNVMLFDKSVKRFPVHFSGFASPVALRSPAPDSGSGWCATPFLYGSFIRDSMPVYPGAFDLSPFSGLLKGVAAAHPKRNFLSPTPDIPILEAASYMGSKHFLRIPVAENGKHEGMVSIGDVNRGLFFSKQSGGE